MSAQWVRCPRCQVALQAGPAVCPACGESLLSTIAPAPSWFVVVNKQKVGPLQLGQLQQMSAEGRLKADDMVLQEGSQKWTSAKAISGLFDAATVEDVNRTVVQPPSVEARAPSAVPIQTVPGYEIIEELGRGGMGVVYKARHTALKRIVALKMILAGGHATAADMARFRTEAQAVARLQHPHIVQIHEIGEKDGLPYFSLEYLDGGTLSKRLSGTPLPAREAAQLVATLALAIDFAHQAGVIHRDLKPANVLLASGGLTPPEGGISGGLHPPLAVVKVADFGLAKKLDDDSGQTRTGAIVGTPSYMSPEQARGDTKDLGPATDIYALGAILYECLTGRPPFRAAGIIETLEQVRTQEPIAPRSFQPQLPRDVETICLKCLAKEPKARYLTAKELADDLQRFLTNQPILARPASLVERAVKYVKRNRMFTGSLTSIFLLMFIGILATSAQASRARKAEKDADDRRKTVQEQLAQSHADAARLFVQRGKLRDALTRYKLALQEGHPSSAELHLHMAQAHVSLYELEEAKPLIEQVLNDPEAKSLHPSALLLKSYSTMGREVTEGLAGVRKALGMGLPPAEAAFARGLLAETSFEAVKHLRESLQHDPYHQPSRVLLGLLLLMLGRTAEADRVAHESLALYPDDPNFRLLAALVLANQGDRKGADQIAKGIRSQVSPRQYRVVELTIELLDLSQQIDAEHTEEVYQRMKLLWLRMIPEMSAAWPGFGGKLSDVPEKGTAQLLQVPPVVNRSLIDVIKGLAGALLGLEGIVGDDKLETALRSHPEGSLHFIHGLVLTEKGRFADARLQLMTAAKAPSIARIRRPALVGILNCDVALAQKGGKYDVEMLKASLPIVRELLQLGPVRPYEVDVCLRICYEAGELDLARVIQSDWEARVGRQNDQAMQWRLRIEEKSSNYPAAVEVAERILQRSPGNTEATRIRKEAIDQLLRLAKKVGG